MPHDLWTSTELRALHRHAKEGLRGAALAKAVHEASGRPCRSVSAIRRALHRYVGEVSTPSWTKEELRVAWAVRLGGHTWPQVAKGLPTYGFPQRSSDAVRLYLRRHPRGVA